MRLVALLCVVLVRVGMVAGLLPNAPFFPSPGIADKNTSRKRTRAENSRGNFHRNDLRMHSTAAATTTTIRNTSSKTRLFGTPPNNNGGGDAAAADNEDEDDEDLFLAVIRENQQRKIKGIAEAARSYDFDFDNGAGVPRESLEPHEIVPLLMKALQHVDAPVVDSGLMAMWEFAGDTTRFIFQNNRTEFIESCHDTARDFPTSFYGTAMNGQSWAVETELNRVGGDTGWIATQVTSTISSDGRLRRWQWELRKNKRPPCLGCWRVENIASSDRKGNFEPD